MSAVYARTGFPRFLLKINSGEEKKSLNMEADERYLSKMFSIAAKGSRSSVHRPDGGTRYLRDT